MIKNWLIDEVQWLLKQNFSQSLQSMQGIGYKEVVGYLQWRYDLETMEELLRRNTHYLAKKQRTRFRRYIDEWIQMPRNDVDYKVFYLD